MGGVLLALLPLNRLGLGEASNITVGLEQKFGICTAFPLPQWSGLKRWWMVCGKSEKRYNYGAAPLLDK